MAESTNNRRFRLEIGHLHLPRQSPNSESRHHKRRRTASEVFIPDELLREILTRLPVKSLMRLRCVSKYWQSIIVDPSFAHDYRGGFRGLLACEPSFPFRPRGKICFFYLSIDGGASQVSYHSTVDHDSKRMRISNVVNGLVCFYDHKKSWLYNIATHERMQLPVSTHEAQSCTYHLGFDPVNKLYKLLKLWPVLKYFDDNHPGDYVNYEILTIGVDSSWRIIYSYPPIEVVFHGVCIDGVLYWERTDSICPSLIAFHLHGERFQVILFPIPEGINSYSLFRFGPRLVAFRSTHRQTSIRYYGNGAWSDEQTFNVVVACGYCPKSIFPDGKVLIFDSCGVYDFPHPFYLFDPSKRELEKIMMYIHPPSSYSSVFVDNGIPYGIWGDTHYYEENIIPLRCLASRGSC